MADVDATARRDGSPAVTRLPSLTALRWLAALAVFGFHVHVVRYFGTGVDALAVRLVAGSGSTGVSFFFILSGFVLMWAYAPSASPGTFWWRRFCRVYPLHAITALVALALVMWPTGDRPGYGPTVANLALVHAWIPDATFFQSLNTVSWTLSCEAFFYLAFPLIAAVLLRCGRRAATGVLTAAVAAVVGGPAVLGAVAGPETATWFFHWSPPGRLPEFVLGVALARLTILHAAMRRTPRLLTLRGAALLAIAGYAAALAVPVPYRYAACTLAGFGALIVAAARADQRGTPSVFRRRWLVRLGELSYAFYLSHLLIMRLVEHLLGARPQWSAGPALLLTGAVFAASLGSAWLLHTVVERPARTFLVRVFSLSAGRETRLTPGAGPGRARPGA